MAKLFAVPTSGFENVFKILIFLFQYHVYYWKKKESEEKIKL